MYNVSEALAYARKMAYFSLSTFCTPPLAQAPAAEMPFKRTTKGTETLGPNRQGFLYQLCLFPLSMTLGMCIYSSSNCRGHIQHCARQSGHQGEGNMSSPQGAQYSSRARPKDQPLRHSVGIAGRKLCAR